MAEAINPGKTEVTASGDKSLELQRMLHAHAARLSAYLNGKLPPDLRSVVDSRDVLQDVFFEAFQRINEFEPRGDDASYRWLVTIARHRVLALIRMQRASKRGGGRAGLKDSENVANVESMLEELAIYSRTPSQSAMSHEVAAVVQKSMSRLEPQYREAIQLRYIDGLSVKQSAERMGRTEGAVFMLCGRALKSLKEHLLQAGAFAR